METNLGIQVDGRLQSIMEAAERGETCPAIYLLVGGWVVQGRPVSTAEFMNITYWDYHRQVAESREGRKISKSVEERDRLIGQHLAPVMAAFGHSSPQDGVALSIANATVSGLSGPNLLVPALRVPVGAVQTWWAAASTVDPARGYSGGVAVGFAT
jgi:hypothetical protein